MIKVGDMVTVSHQACREVRLAERLPVTGTLMSLEVWDCGTVYAVVRTCHRRWGINAAAIAAVDRTAFRWRRNGKAVQS